MECGRGNFLWGFGGDGVKGDGDAVGREKILWGHGEMVLMSTTVTVQCAILVTQLTVSEHRRVN